MPVVYMQLKETMSNILRPIVMSVVNHITKDTGMFPLDRIYFPGESESAPHHGSSQRDNNTSATFITKRSLSVTVDEPYDTETLHLGNPLNNPYPAFFKDDALKVYLRPTHAITTVTLTLTLRSPNRSELLRWRDTMYSKSASPRRQYTHDASYAIAIPEPYMLLLADIYAAKEAVAGYGDSFVDYLRQHADPGLTVVSDGVGGNRHFAVRARQSRIQGEFDNEGLVDKPEHDSSTGVWSININYHFTYDKPIGCSMAYPVMIHNQLLPEKYIKDSSFDYTDGMRPYQYPYATAGLSVIESISYLDRITRGGKIAYLPATDDFTEPSGIMPATSTVFYALCSVEPDTVGLVNLGMLGDIVMDPDVLACISAGEYAYMNAALYDSFFRLDLYIGDAISPVRAMIDSGLNISAASPLDLRDIHRVRFSVVNDLSLLTPAALSRLRANPVVALKYLAAINQTSVLRSDVVLSNNQASLTPADLLSAYIGTLLNTPDNAKVINNVNVPLTPSGLGLTQASITNIVVNSGRPTHVLLTTMVVNRT